MSPNCKLLQQQVHRDMLFMPQLAHGSVAHQSFLAETTNYGFLMPVEHGVPHEKPWTLSPPPEANWTAAGTLLEQDDTLPGSGIPKGTVSFESLPNIIWTMNREKGIMIMAGTQLLPIYDVDAHNLVVQFIYDAWKVFS